jgi:hypothetical protein
MTAVRLLLPQGGLLRWHRALAARLAADGDRVLVALRPRRGAPSSLTQLIETLEEWVQRGRAPAATLREPPGAWCAADYGEADLVFDLTGSVEAEPGAVVAFYDGAAGDAARDAALLDGRAPWIELVAVDADGPRVYASALPALPSRDRLIAGRADIAAVLAVMIRALVRRGPAEAPPLRPHAATPTRSALARTAASFSDLIARRMRRLVVNDGHWRVGLRRRAPGAAPFVGLDRLEDSGWRWLEDDRRRYFADPFLFEAGGVDYLFCEEFPYATGKGVISVFAVDEAGNPGSPSVVLERPYHLSYPLVFRHDGQIWMMPESGENRTLELYRAERFPDRWTLDRVLISGAEIGDATPFAWRGQWWLTATTGETVGSTWDSLSLFSGPGPLGPWTPAIDGPALIDASAARPAGAVFEHEGALWRPAQDCRAGYGSGLALCRVDALAPGVFRQTPMRRFAPPGGLHTFNMTDRFAAIDAAGPRARAAWLAGFDG